MKQFHQDTLSLLPSDAEGIADKLATKKAKIGVVGLGYVGMPIALEYAKKGYHVHGVDVAVEKIEQLSRGENFIEDLVDEEVKSVVSQGLLTASTSYDPLTHADVIFVAVPTPFNENKDPDLSYILQASVALSEVITPETLIILKSTTFPGTTEEYMRPRLDQSGLRLGKEYFLAFSPERVDPGNRTWHTGNTPIVVGGVGESSTILAAWANRQIIDQIYIVDSPKIAELEKLLENIFRSVNIALVNELAMLCERMGGINVWEVIEAAGTKPFGFLKFTPGPGVGGHCIPIDPYYLSWLAREYDFETRFITLAANVNEGMPYHVADLVVRSIAKQPITLSDAKVLLLGASFKKNVKDLRHSPAEAIICRLQDEGITHIDYSDPWAPEYRVGEKTYYSVPLTAEAIAQYDCVVMVTDHDDFDIAEVVRHAKAVVDTRNMTKDVVEGREKIVLLGHTDNRRNVLVSH